MPEVRTEGNPADASRDVANRTPLASSQARERRFVWDLPLRLFHWLFALSIVASWVTAELGFDWMQWHFYLGYWMIGLLTFRVIWGFIGPRHARFASFLASPPSTWRYLRNLFKGASLYTPGHNPAGGLMVILMLLLVALQVTTGLFATDDVVWSGPYNPAVSKDLASRLTTIHHINFNFILAAVVLHLAAITFYGLVKKQNLVLPMLTGHKPAPMVPHHEAIKSSELIKALLVCLLSAGLVYYLIAHAPPPSDSLY
jgi:cytochrome b